MTNAGITFIIGATLIYLGGAFLTYGSLYNNCETLAPFDRMMCENMAPINSMIWPLYWGGVVAIEITK